MKIICTTSDAYSHILPIFCYLFNKNWSSNLHVEVVGYKKPSFDLPSNFTFHSLGVQTDSKKDFSNDLRKYFEKQSQYFIWLMEDSFIKKVDLIGVDILKKLTHLEDNVGRVNLTKETVKQDHYARYFIYDDQIFANTQTAKYRLSTQPSIWNRDFLLKYLTQDLTPWEFETQESINDGYQILGFNRNIIDHNEGVRRFDISKSNLDGIEEKQLLEMKSLNII